MALHGSCCCGRSAVGAHQTIANWQIHGVLVRWNELVSGGDNLHARLRLLNNVVRLGKFAALGLLG